MNIIRKKWFRIGLILVSLAPWVYYYLLGNALNDNRVNCAKQQLYYDLKLEQCVSYLTQSNQLGLSEIYPTLFYGAIALTMFIMLLFVFIPSDKDAQSL